jgi:hypothetical protein
VSGSGVRRRVVFAEICFRLDDPPGERNPTRFSNQKFAEQGSRHATRVAIEKP